MSDDGIRQAIKQGLLPADFLEVTTKQAGPCLVCGKDITVYIRKGESWPMICGACTEKPRGQT